MSTINLSANRDNDTYNFGNLNVGDLFIFAEQTDNQVYMKIPAVETTIADETYEINVLNISRGTYINPKVPNDQQVLKYDETKSITLNYSDFYGPEGMPIQAATDAGE